MQWNTLFQGDGNLYTALYAFGTVALGNGGVIKGGSMNLSNNLARTYRQKGGVIHYNSPVEEIVFEGKNIVGVKLKTEKFEKRITLSQLVMSLKHTNF